MKARDYTPLLAQLEDEYARRSPRSRELGEQARRSMVDGGSHPLRLIEPFPPRIAMACGAYVTDEDGHEILDLWQGHYANVLGHNPPLITAALAQALQQGYALQAGFTDRLQIEVAEILCRQCGAERVRFAGGTYSGHPATMVAARTMLAHLAAEEAAVYPRLSALGDAARRAAGQALAAAGIYAICTGEGNAAIPSGSLFQVHFPYQVSRRIERPEDALDPAVCDVALANRILPLAMLLEDVHVVHGGGALSTAHSEADVTRMGEAFVRAAELVKPYL